MFKSITPVVKEQIDNIYHAMYTQSMALGEIWQTDMLFTWQWWLCVFLSVLPWLLWFKVRKQSSTFRLLCAAFFIIAISSFLDMAGIAYGLWVYYVTVALPLPPFIPFDSSILPVSAMLLIQWQSKAQAIYKGIFYGAVLAFIGEPLLTWAGLYNPKAWQYYYSFPIYTVIYLSAHYLATRNEYEKI